MISIEINKNVSLKKGRDLSFKKQHHWIFSESIKNTQNSPLDGDLVWILNNNSKKIGYGFYGNQSIAVRVLSFNPETTPVEQVSSLLNLALNKRKKLGLVNSKITNAYRLFHSEGDKLPGLTIDIYNDIIVIQFHHNGLENFVDQIRNFLIENFLSLKTIILKHGKSREEKDNFQLILGTEVETTIIENSISFVVNVLEGQKTGFFLDQRDNREIVYKISKQKTVLNLFSFSGGFSLYAIKGGASRVVSVDSSKQAIDQALRNYSILNNPGNHEFIIKDCKDYLVENSEKFDIVICDPPALVKGKKDLFKGLKHYTYLQKLALSKLKINGTFLTFSCSQFVKESDLRKCLETALFELELKYKKISSVSQAKCHTYNKNHPESLYLKGFMIVL